MKKTLRTLRTTVATAALLGCAINNTYSQEVIVGAEFDTYFNNLEFTPCQFGGASETFFTARLTPFVGIEFAEGHSIVFGAELWQNMGELDEKFLSEIQPLMYYKFESERADAMAGIFDNRELKGDYSLAIFSDEYKFYRNRIMGFMGRYNSTLSSDSFVELAVNWEGKFSAEQREMFRIISGGEWHFDNVINSDMEVNDLYLGYGFSMLHFANSAEVTGIVDNLIANPFVGYKFGNDFEFDVRVGAFVAPQCDRKMDEGWDFPAGGELTLGVSRWGVEIENSIYLGKALQPYYNKGGYAALLYAGDNFYNTDSGIYDRLWVGYSNSFFGDLLAVRGGVALHCDGHGLGTQQLIGVTVDFEHLFSLKK